MYMIVDIFSGLVILFLAVLVAFILSRLIVEIDENKTSLRLNQDISKKVKKNKK